MSRSGRKRISKWDLKETSELSVGERQYNDGLVEEGKFVYFQDLQPVSHTKEIAASNDPKCYGVEVNKSDSTKFSDGTMIWDGDGSYGTRMSPGLDDWRQQKRSHSPKNSWHRSYRNRSRSRTRSRSPALGFKRGPQLIDRSIGGQLCKDLAAGRCRRGDHCSYIHQDDGNYEDKKNPEGSLMDSRDYRQRRDGTSRYLNPVGTGEYHLRTERSKLCSDFSNGKCFRGTSCRYAHHSAASDGFDRGSPDEAFKERENDRRNKSTSFERNREHEPRRNGDIPCKFFAAGNCRNGKFCRFSHHGQVRTSSDSRSQDAWRKPSNNSSNVGQSSEGLKLSDTNVPDVAKLHDWSEEINEDEGALEKGAAAWSMQDRWEHNFSNENRSLVPLADNGKAVDSNDRKFLQLNVENTSGGVGVPESRGAENWHGYMEISPAWNNRVQSPNYIVKEEISHISQTSQSLTLGRTSLPPSEQYINQEASCQSHHTAMQPMIHENSSSFQSNLKKDSSDGRKTTADGVMSLIDLNFSAHVLPDQILDRKCQSSSAFNEPHSSSDATGQNQQTFLPCTPKRESIAGSQNQQLFLDSNLFSKSDAGDAKMPEASEIPPAPSIVSTEQLSQLSNLSASLAHLLGNGQQLPQLYASLNSQDLMEIVPPSLSKSAGPVASLPEAYGQPDPAIGSREQHDPTSDSIEPSKPEFGNPIPGFSTDFIKEKSIKDGKLGFLSNELFLPPVSGGPNGAAQCRTGNFVVDPNHESQSIKLDPDCDGDGKNGIVDKQSKKAQEIDALVKNNGDNKADDGKKNVDAKGIRAFKFALVEIVKDLLKPMWKEGQVSKEVHKTIVKKVVDKVMSSLQGAHIPQSQERIDNYLSISKPKVNKLVQAYVEKYQRS